MRMQTLSSEARTKILYVEERRVNAKAENKERRNFIIITAHVLLLGSLNQE